MTSDMNRRNFLKGSLLASVGGALVLGSESGNASAETLKQGTPKTPGGATPTSPHQKIRSEENPLDSRNNSPETASAFKISWRIKACHYESDEQFERLLALFAGHREVVNEIALFIGNLVIWHAYEPLEDLAAKAKVARKRLEQLRAKGFTNLGMNVWPTFGAECLGWEQCPPLPFQPAVSFDGSVAHSTACIQTPEFLTYTRKRYALVAGAHPEFIWVDDDTRMTDLGIAFPCFCDTCLSVFEAGAWKRREELVAALNSPQKGALRKKWIEFNTTKLERLCSEIKQAIHTVDPGIDIGWMTVGPTHSTYSGRYIYRCGRILGGRRGRPGHGFYTDEKPRDLIGKALEVGRQLREYPHNLTDIQYEYEDYPSIVLNKSLQTAANEITTALAMGCTGVAMNTLHLGSGSLDENMPLLERLAVERPAWGTLAASCHGLPLRGLWPANTPMMMANRSIQDHGWFNEGDPLYNITLPNQWTELGFAFTNDPVAACAVLLAGNVADAFSDDELRKMLSGAVFMDVHALQVLHKRGLGDLTGVKPGEQFSGVLERMTDHELNGSYAGNERCTYVDSGWALQSTDKKTEVLANLMLVSGHDRGPCLTAYRNGTGGRVVVMSYAPWTHLGRPSKWHQLRALVDWATENEMPLVFDRPIRVTPFVRMSPDGTRFVIVLLNNGLDPTGPLSFTIRVKGTRVWLVQSSGARVPLRTQKAGGNGFTVTLDNLPAWQMAILVGES